MCSKEIMGLVEGLSVIDPQEDYTESAEKLRRLNAEFNGLMNSLADVCVCVCVRARARKTTHA